MADKHQPALHFPDHFAYLGEPSSVLPLEVGATFWEDLMGGKLAHLGPGRLVSFASFESDWKMWENTYSDFYYATQKASVGSIVNNAGYRILQHVDLNGLTNLVEPGKY